MCPSKNPTDPAEPPRLRRWRWRIPLPLPRIVRTTAFRFALSNVLVFSLFGIILLLVLNWQLRQSVQDRLVATVASEYQELLTLYRRGGLVQLANEIESRSTQGSDILYLLGTRDGRIFTGNILDLSDQIFMGTGWTDFRYIPRFRSTQIDGGEGASNTMSSTAIARVFALDTNLALLLGHDTGELDRISAATKRVGGWSMLLVVALGLIGGVISARRVLSRIDSLTEATRRIMAGEISNRLTISGTGDEIDRLASSVNTMLDRIEQLLAGLHEVSVNIAHELKIPLTRLRNLAESATAEGGDRAFVNARLADIVNESVSLISVFDALLLIARIEAGSAVAELVATDVRTIVRDVVELYEPLAEAKGIALVAKTDRSSPPCIARIHRELLALALSNLISNAIKYAAPSASASHPGGTTQTHDLAEAAHIRADAVREIGRIFIRVSDHGPGIPASERERIVQRFQRLERDAEISGSGLGLSLVNAIARHMGGTLMLEDNAPGVCAIIALPRVEGSHQAHSTHSPAHPATTPTVAA